MKKLSDLRSFLIEHPVRVDAASLLTFAEKGTVSYEHDPENRSFSMSYDAHVIIRDFSSDFAALVFVILGWYADHETGFASEAIKFHVDILDHDRADLSFLIPLNEDVRALEVAGGHNLFALDDPDIHRIGMPHTPPEE